MLISNPDYRIPDGGGLDLELTAQARSHSYRLFGRLFLEGVTESLWPYVQAVAELQAAVPTPFDADEAAATHHSLFAFNLFPYESIFLDSSGLLGGEVAQAVEQSYGEMGFAVDAAATGQDHLGYELLCLAYLSGAEALAWKKGRPEQAQWWRQKQRYFLENHLLRWLIACVVAVEQLGDSFYTGLGQLTVALVADHYDSLGTDDGLARPAFVLPGETPPVDDAHTGLRQISHYLLTPCQSGVYLGRQEIGVLAQALRLPRGFGGREEMLRNVWEAAAQYDHVPALMQAVQERLHRWQVAYEGILTDYPVLLPFGRAWQTRAEQSHQFVAALLSRLPAGHDESPICPP